MLKIEKQLKNKVILYKYKLPLFKSILWIIVSNTIAKGIDFAEDKISKVIAYEKDKKTLAAYAYAFEKENGSLQYIIFIKKTASPGEIAHEAKHILNIIFNWNGHKITSSNDEIECHYLQELVDRCWFVIKKYKRNKY